MGNVPIFNIKIASQLVRRGFIVADLQPNEKMPNKTVVYFKHNNQLTEILNEEYNIKIRRNINGNESRNHSRR